MTNPTKGAGTSTDESPVTVLDDRMRDLVAPDAALVRLGGGAGWAEGPVWLDDIGELWFSDIIGNRVLRYATATGDISEAVPDVEYSNGHTLDHSGRIVQCSHGRRQLELMDRDGTITALTSTAAGLGVRLNSPNDAVVAADGAIWFTDPAYGLQSEGEGHPGELEYGACWVFRYDPSTEATTIVVTDMQRPNGLAFSPDESLLYVADSAGANYGGNHNIRVYEVEGHRVVNGRVFAEIEPGVPDGLRVDARGNVWTTQGDGVSVYAPDGTRVGHIAVPETPANLSIGGRGPAAGEPTRLYITATTSLYAIDVAPGFVAPASPGTPR
jgi:gluconolactonase